MMGVSARAGERAVLAQRSLGNGVHFVWLRVNIMEHYNIRFIVLFSWRGRSVGSPDQRQTSSFEVVHEDVYMQSVVVHDEMMSHKWKVEGSRVTVGFSFEDLDISLSNNFNNIFIEHSKLCAVTHQ